MCEKTGYIGQSGDTCKKRNIEVSGQDKIAWSSRYCLDVLKDDARVLHWEYRNKAYLNQHNT